MSKPKFTDADIIYIRTSVSNGGCQKDLAREYNTTRYHMDRIVRNITYKHVVCHFDPARNYSKGSHHPNAILTEDLVADCRQRVAKGETNSDLAKELGVSVMMLHQAIVGTTWKHVKTPTVRVGRVHGEEHYLTKLTDNQVREILKRYKAGEKASSLVKAFDTSTWIIHAILTGETWRHITGGVNISRGTKHRKHRMNKKKRKEQ